MNVIRAGHIQLVVDPVDATVFIDGYKVMQRPDLSYIVNLLEGRHRLQVVREGFKPYDQPLDVPGGGWVCAWCPAGEVAEHVSDSEQRCSCGCQCGGCTALLYYQVGFPHPSPAHGITMLDVRSTGVGVTTFPFC